MSVIKFFILLQIGSFIYTSALFGQIPQFVSEKIEITISDNLCLIEGDYFFLSDYSVPIKKNLFYPFPVDSLLLYPDLIKVKDVQKNKNISFTKTKTGIYFPIEIPQRKTVIYKVFYSQKIKGNRAEYILTTTQKWGRALEKADFIIKLPKEFELKYLSYEYDKMETVNNYIIYKIHKENFMPEKNLIVDWVKRLK